MTLDPEPVPAHDGEPDAAPRPQGVEEDGLGIDPDAVIEGEGEPFDEEEQP